MSKIVIGLIALLFIISVEANARLSYGKYCVRTMEKSINKNCIKFALNKTNDAELSKCFIENDNNFSECNYLKNYNIFIINKNNCITNIHAYQGMYVLVILVLWIIIGFVCK